jgi:DNA-binding transcriptional ArsR family regulator
MRTKRAQFKPAGASLAQLKALADPLRYQIFENLVGEARTAKQMAQIMATHPTRLYHHFRVLETAGLIRKVGMKKKRGTVEKYFQAVVDRIEVRDGAASATDFVPALLAGVLASTSSDLKNRASTRKRISGEAQTYLKRYRIRATPKQASEILSRLEALSELCESGSANEGEKVFGLLLAFYETPSPRQ